MIKDDSREFIRNVFESVVTKYDSMNDFMTLGAHRLWKKHFCALSKIKNQNPQKILDMSCGTGDISIQILKLNPDSIITMCDPEIEMLNIANSKIINSGFSVKNINIENSTAEEFTMSKYINFYDICFTSFGVRNFSNIKIGVSNIYNSLKNGGKWMVMEFSSDFLSHGNIENQTKFLKIKQKILEFYIKSIIPQIGFAVANDKSSYQYLSDSILKFPKSSDFIAILKSAGFKEVYKINFVKDIVNIYIANK